MALKIELNDEDEIKSKDIQDIQKIENEKKWLFNVLKRRIQLDFNFKLIKEIGSEEKEKFKSL